MSYHIEHPRRGVLTKGTTEKGMSSFSPMAKRDDERVRRFAKLDDALIGLARITPAKTRYECYILERDGGHYKRVDKTLYE